MKKHHLKLWLIIVPIVVVLAALYFFVFRWSSFNSFDEYADTLEDQGRYAGCSVAGINLHGNLLTYVPVIDEDGDFASAEHIYADLESAEANVDVQAIILEIDSYGGSPVAAEELATKLKLLQKPVIVMIREGGASAAYWVATGADRIFASELSDVGSIGVTMSYADNSVLNARDGYTWNSISTGKFKDSGSADKPLTADERKLFERDLQIIFDKFVDTVAENRNMSREKVLSLADGSTMLGGAALQAGLIDQIGNYDDVKAYLTSTYGIEPDVCW